MTTPDEIRATLRVIATLERFQVRYLIGGSFASSLHGIPRTTNDADILAEMRLQHVDPVVNDLEQEAYVSRDAVLDAVRRGTSFNVIHLETVFKVDVFVMTADPLQVEEMARRQRHRTSQASGEEAFFASAEDTVLQKLIWYDKGGRTSDRQWQDILGVLRVQGAALDLAYVRRWADVRRLRDLLEQAIDEAV